MKQTITKLLGGALLALLFLMPSSVKAEKVTLADWQFSTLYVESSNSGKTYYYTPNTSETYAGIGHYWYSDRVPVFYPQTYVGSQTSYEMTAASKGRYWQVGQSGPTFLNESYVANEITDWNDKESHNVYVELSFPTTGYKDIELDFGYRSYNGVAGISVIVSTDGGTTWHKGDDIAAVSSLTDEVVNLGVANESSVKVRLLCENGKSGYSYFSYFTIKGNLLGETQLYSGSVSVDNASHGDAIIIPAGGVYESGSSVTVTATPNIGYAFVEWQDGLGNTLSTANPYDVTMTENKTIVAVYEIAPIAAGTEVTAASWTFDTGYDVSAGVYTPNTSDWKEIAWKWNNTDKVVANKTINTASNYTVWSKTKRAWSIREVNSKKVYAFYTTSDADGANSISDYTNGENHNLFVEFAFPTKGLEGINIDLDFSANSGAKFELVYSTDNGTNWTYKGQYSGGTNEDISINAADKDKVLVRLIEENGKLDQLNINYFKVKGIISTTTVSISDAKYATYYNSIPVQLPANLQAATIDNETGGTLTLNYRYGEGDVIPGGTAVLLKGTAAGDYTLTMQPAYVTAAPAGNLLYGSDEATTTTGGGTGAKYYALQYGSGTKSDVLGFYWVNTDGAAFMSGAHKAWLALPASTPANFFALDDETTGIKAVETSPVYAGKYYDLQGRQVVTPAKDLYIVNGKKVVIK